MAEVHDFDMGDELVKYGFLGVGEWLRGLCTRRREAHHDRLGGLNGARIGLSHNTVGPAAMAAVMILEGATRGAG
ncbi:hypothetical protein BST36_15610 [Mycolicibacterium moriokaense]|nr:hypothetical protein BST36_15610 [Mycolicibacterium moriokaense]